MLFRTLPVVLCSAFVAFVPPASGDSPLTDPAVKASPAIPVAEGADSTISELKESIPGLVKEARIPGLQIALIRDGKVVWEGAYGITSTDGGVAVTTETIFEAASLTKPLFAYVVMQMVDKKSIDLDAPLIAMVPKDRIEELLGHPLDAEGFRLDWAKKITARHILSHSAGMPHGESGEVYPLFFEPGSDWKYSAAGYRFLQFVIEGIEGKPLEEIVDAYVLGPLGMKHSSMVWREAYEKTMANGHSLYGTRQDFRRRREANSAASLYTTAGDYARFVCAVLDGKRLEPETAKEMLTSVINMNDEGNLGWGLGFGTQEDGERTAFWQWGDYGIFRDYVIADPVKRSGVVYLTNSFNGLAVCSALVKKCIGQEALGCLDLGYLQYDSPVYALMWDLEEKGPQAAIKHLPKLVKEHPDVFTDERINGMAETMENEEMYDEAVAIYRFASDQNPRSGEALFNLAHANLLTGDLAEAKKLLEASLSAPEDPAERERVDWAVDYVKAIQEPATLDLEYLQKIAGDYGPRHLAVVDGTLHYSRENAATSKPRPLLALSSDTFVLEGVTYFKLQVVLDEEGNPTALVGLYENGNKDESPRDPR